MLKRQPKVDASIFLVNYEHIQSSRWPLKAPFPGPGSAKAVSFFPAIWTMESLYTVFDYPFFVRLAKLRKLVDVVAAGVVCYNADSYNTLLLGRTLYGLGIGISLARLGLCTQRVLMHYPFFVPCWCCPCVMSSYLISQRRSQSSAKFPCNHM